MADIIPFLILVVAALGLVSAMIYINLRSQHVPMSRVRVMLIELWAGFALIIAIFLYISHILGTSTTGSFAGELASRLSRWHELAVGQQAIIIAGVLLALLLFLLFLRSLSLAQRPARHRISPPDGGIEP